ncbi:MAG: 1-(5-phosphoribosyl)-5-[(5-phosphoribosylamino)methylideneamino] imidazole-4-carboxamide isomerase [Chloroflexi bacterium]|nr:1-(5-phosphoribosyl)-5-[(5-phosphoribosylamino)methylideneamino] imidazole-4-carboxamide isomerase [Chloroflexota bacterium]
MQQAGKGFDLFPAIDLRGGRVVRLRQGDFSRETAYADDPVAVARALVDGGATWLHVVDLDGARAGRPVQTSVIDRIVAAVGSRAAVEVGGGLRTSQDVRRILDVGAARAVVGTAALEQPDFAATLVAAHGRDAVAAALDVRDGFALGTGWVRGAAGLGVADAIERLAAAGIAWFEVTAVARDGTLEGPDLELVRSVLADGRARVIAAGGIATVADIRAVRDLGCAGVIIGRALYDGTLDLAAALDAGRRLGVRGAGGPGS